MRLTVTRGRLGHSAYQSDNQFVVEVRPKKGGPVKLTRAPTTVAKSCR